MEKHWINKAVDEWYARNEPQFTGGLKDILHAYYKNDAHPQPAPEPFKVPVVEFSHNAVYIGDFCMEDDLEKGSYDDEYRENWQAIAHACDMLIEAKKLIGTGEVDADEWRDRLDAGPGNERKRI